MKLFNLERALAGNPVVTRSGLEIIRVIHVPEAILLNERVICVTFDGYLLFRTELGERYENDQHEYDLFMAPIKKTWYFNFYEARSLGFPTFKEAIESAHALYGPCLRTAVPMEVEL
jgi:hypothetical protein